MQPRPWLFELRGREFLVNRKNFQVPVPSEKSSLSRETEGRKKRSHCLPGEQQPRCQQEADSIQKPPREEEEEALTIADQVQGRVPLRIPEQAGPAPALGTLGQHLSCGESGLQPGALQGRLSGKGGPDLLRHRLFCAEQDHSGPHGQSQGDARRFQKHADQCLLRRGGGAVGLGSPCMDLTECRPHARCPWTVVVLYIHF
uniref:Splicing factor SWAP n=1 Tax=Molossus molossus TaxID=27622 RepID=A0A7J8BZS4_MOLMO|nr:splicing factor SWAP [Molossus molossus]